MAFVVSALGSLIPKLLQLTQDEYKLQTGAREQVESLVLELQSMHAALCKVAKVPHEKLDEQVKIWATQVREASYDMEDIVDDFLVRINGGNKTANADKSKVDDLIEKMGNMFSLSKIKARRDIASTINDITKRVDEIAKRRERYKVDDQIARFGTTPERIDPRLLYLHNKTSELVGINKPRDALIKELSQGDDDDTSDNNMRVVSIYGCGGLGKTTLAQVVYDKLANDMSIKCKAFVSVGQDPDIKTVFRNIILGLHEGYFKANISFIKELDQGNLIDEIHALLKEKRYIIVMDDVWEVSTWEAIRTTLKDNNFGSKIIITTRSSDVAHVEQVHYSYELKPLLHEASEELFYGRIFGPNEKCPQRFSRLSQHFLKKCGGVPLAIITLSSLLAKKLDIAEWEELCNATGLGISSSGDGMSNMVKILSLSYYDLPSYLKSCFLYLSMFPEDWVIDTDQLIWMWVAEGFIQPQENCDDLFQLGKSYFIELINRSLVQPMGPMDSYDQDIYSCRVHDMILDLIHFLAREENFITASEQGISSKTKQIHRLSLNKATTRPELCMSRVRSFAMFNPCIDSLPSLSSFGVLRVLALVDCYFEDKGIKLNVTSLIHLRCLWLRNTGLKELPKGIGKLHNLQVLYMSEALHHVSSVPSIFRLKRLVCIKDVICYPMPGNLLRNLTGLQVLDHLYLDEHSAGTVEELGHLTKLTELHIVIKMKMDQSIVNGLISSIGKLLRLQKLHISTKYFLNRKDFINWENWVPPRQIRELDMCADVALQTLPKWINCASLPHLTMLLLNNVSILRPEDIQILGELPYLRHLWLQCGENNLTGPLQKFVLSSHAFPRVTSYKLRNVVTVPSMFPQGAMSKVECFWFYLRAWDFFFDDGLHFSDLALEHFPSLRYARFTILGRRNLEEVEKVKEAVKHAVDVHTNRPSIEFCR